MKDLKLQLIRQGSPMVYACEGGGLQNQRNFCFLTYQNKMR